MSPCACQCLCDLFFRAMNIPHTKYPAPNAISNHAASPPRNDSTVPNLFIEIPKAMPMMPNIIELDTWPIPHITVMHVVLARDHFRARAITINGR